MEQSKVNKALGIRGRMEADISNFGTKELTLAGELLDRYADVKIEATHNEQVELGEGLVLVRSVDEVAVYLLDITEYRIYGLNSDGDFDELLISEDGIEYYSKDDVDVFGDPVKKDK